MGKHRECRFGTEYEHNQQTAELKSEMKCPGNEATARRKCRLHDDNVAVDLPDVSVRVGKMVKDDVECAEVSIADCPLYERGVDRGPTAALGKWLCYF